MVKYEVDVTGEGGGHRFRVPLVLSGQKMNTFLNRFVRQISTIFFQSVDQIDHEVRFNVATELVYALLENLDPTWCERISKYAILDSQTNATLEFAPSSLGLSCITLKPKVFFQ